MAAGAVCVPLLVSPALRAPPLPRRDTWSALSAAEVFGALRVLARRWPMKRQKANIRAAFDGLANADRCLTVQLSK